MNRPIKVIHFADAHIDMVNDGRHDPATGLPWRVRDYLDALDQIINYAIEQRADLVVFAGDAYRNQRPQPQYQKEWQSRMMRLSQAKIPTILLVGNHDTSPSTRHAHALQEFETLNIPYIFVSDKPRLWGSAELGIPAQVVTIPWLGRSVALTKEDHLALDEDALAQKLEEVVANTIERLLDSADATLPTLLTAHATVSGAKFGSERQLLLSRDFTLGRAILSDHRVDYVAMGHIHQHQVVNQGYPAIVYSGSIERLNFGEPEEKGFVQVTLQRNKTSWEFIKLKTRRFVDTEIKIDSAEELMPRLLTQLPRPEKIKGAICRLRLIYQAEWEPLIDEATIGRYYKEAATFQLSKQRTHDRLMRLSKEHGVETLSPSELLNLYWQTKQNYDPEEAGVLQQLAKELFKGLPF